MGVVQAETFLAGCGQGDLNHPTGSPRSPGATDMKQGWKGEMLSPRIGPVSRFAIIGFVIMMAAAAVLGWQVALRVEQDVLAEAITDVRETVSDRLTRRLAPTDFNRPLVGERYDTFHAFVQESVLVERVVRVKIWNKEGRVIYSDNREMVGRVYPVEGELREALAGEIAAEVTDLAREENADDRGIDNRLIEVYLPIRLGSPDEVVGAYEAYFRWAPVAARIDDLSRLFLISLGAGSLFLYLVGLLMLNGAARTITRLLHQAEHRAEELDAVYAALRETHLSTLEILAAAVEARDPYTHGHSQRVRDYSLALAGQLGLADEATIETIRRAAMLHDVGKIGVADSILKKPGKLEKWEYAEMQRHPEIGWHMLCRTSFLKDELDLVRYHHERYDGLGYPSGITGEHMPLGARILAVADAFDAMTSDRPYRRALSAAVAREELVKNAGTQFCPKVVTAMLDVIDAEFGVGTGAAGEMESSRTRLS
ncbi:MAG: HD-GYP domain-containing protein [Chloroflexi bacterium]|nr:HD-GYP domain-containing protein [Chloroflexota bacterium]